METNLLILGEAIHNALVECSLKEGQFSDNLEGACAIASSFFIKEAKRLLGMRISFMATVSHAWTSYKGNVYDITATQFGRKEKVFTSSYKSIQAMKDCWMRECYMKPRIVTLDRINNRWPSYQRPINYRLNWVSAHTARVVHLKSKLS
jgi:hypothetical protein